MVAMIFEYWLNEEHKDEYTSQSTKLRELLYDFEGLISVERFRSDSDPGKYVTLGFFRDEEAVKEWRTQADHRQAQVLGRTRLFSDYRLRMADVTRDYGKTRRGGTPNDSVELKD